MIAAEQASSQSRTSGIRRFKDPYSDDLEIRRSSRRRACMTTPQLRGEVKRILLEMEEACHRPLFEELIIQSGGGRIGDMCDERCAGSTPTKLDSLGDGIARDVEGVGASSGRSKKRPRQEHHQPKTGLRGWDELLADAATLLPFMSPEEHGFASRLASIMLLGYLLPNSTGNDFFTIQKYPSNIKSTTLPSFTGTATSSEGLSSSSPFITMSLEERLENSIQFHTAQQYGEIETCTDATVTSSFREFLTRGLGRFLSGRPAHGSETDLIHLLAMSISPSPVFDSVHGSSASTPSSDEDRLSPSRRRADRLMTAVHSHYFYINYTDRAELVRMIADKLVLPEYDSLSLVVLQEPQPPPQDPSVAAAAAVEMDSPLFHGALRHLRSSLGGFASGSLSNSDANQAYKCLANIAIQTGYGTFISEEWDALVKRAIDDRCGYRCSCADDDLERGPNSGKYVNGNKLSRNVRERVDCPHTATGKIMADFICRYNGSRHYADEAFTRRALSKLSISIKSEVALMIESHPKGRQNVKRKPPPVPCLMASLLNAARTLFYFFLAPRSSGDAEEEGEGSDGGVDAEEENEGNSITDIDEEQKEEERQKDVLIKCAIELLCHPNLLIVRSASSLLALALCYGGREQMKCYTKDIFVSVRFALRQAVSDLDGANEDRWPEQHRQVANALQAVIITMARRSYGFSDALVSTLIEMGDAARTKEDVAFRDAVYKFILRVLASLALSQPGVISGRYNEVEKTLISDTKSSKGSKLHPDLVFICLSCRLARFFATDPVVSAIQSRVKTMLEDTTDPWLSYKVARHAVVTGNFVIADGVYNRLLRTSSSEQSFLWLTALAKTAEAENIISLTGALGIPHAIPLFHSAIFHMSSISSIRRADNSTLGMNNPPSFSFQIQLLNSRIDFLELVTTARGLSSEMRLTGMAPQRSTRSCMHQRNTVHCFYALASRYHQLYRQHGIMHCQQTRTSLRTLFALCRFLGRAAGKVFSESLSGGSRLYDFHQNSSIPWPKGDESHPICKLIHKFEEQIILPMEEGVDPIIRAAAFIEILDGVLKVPVPFPRGFMTVKSPPMAQIRLTADPNQIDSIGIDENGDDTTECDLNDDAEVVDVVPGFPCTIYASGLIPDAYFRMSELLFSQVVAWYSVYLDGPLTSDEEPLRDDPQTFQGQSSGGNRDELDEEERVSVISEIHSSETPFCSPLLPHGRFVLPIECAPINHEGFYKLEVKLGCRDIRFGEWEIPTRRNAGTIFLCVSSQSKDDETASTEGV